MQSQEQAGWLQLLSQSLEDLSKGKAPGWTKLRLRNWSDGKDFRLESLERVWTGTFNQSDRSSFKVLPPASVPPLANALHLAAIDLLEDPALSIQSALSSRLSQQNLPPIHMLALGLSDRETEYSGVECWFHLNDAINATLAADSGVHAALDKTPAHIDFHYRGQPVSREILVSMSNAMALASGPGKPRVAP